MAGKWTVSCVYFGAEAVNRQREKVTAEPSLWLHTSHMPSLPGQRLSPETALHSLLGEDSELIFLVTAQAAVHTCGVVLAWSCPLSFVFLVSSPSSSWCSWSLAGLQHFPCLWYSWLLNCFPRVSCSTCFWQPQPGLPPLPPSITATALSLWSTSHCSVSSTGQLGITCFFSLLFLSLSCTASALHQGWRSLQMSAYSTRLWIAFSALHVGTEDVDIAHFWCSDITRDRSEQGKSVMIYCKSACRTPPSSSSSVLASPSLSTQATTLFLSSLHVIFPPLQLGGLLWPFFSFGGFKALSLVPPLSPSHSVSGWFHLQAEFKFLIITRSTSYCSSVSWPVFQTFLSGCLFKPHMALK